ncbi:hypothetical protein B296_00029069 [Ensete ventricosum]|uniref:Secreted protein n=1 Tax=Ensete ventricosum TaxID=4639 RepID=A0A426XIG9_ENSVE|nr:hypothetical protein B296_00029069 [Ensete ventricosum]
MGNQMSVLQSSRLWLFFYVVSAFLFCLEDIGDGEREKKAKLCVQRERCSIKSLIRAEFEVDRMVFFFFLKEEIRNSTANEQESPRDVDMATCRRQVDRHRHRVGSRGGGGWTNLPFRPALLTGAALPRSFKSASIPRFSPQFESATASIR